METKKAKPVKAWSVVDIENNEIDVRNLWKTIFSAYYSRKNLVYPDKWRIARVEIREVCAEPYS